MQEMVALQHRLPMLSIASDLHSHPWWQGANVRHAQQSCSTHGVPTPGQTVTLLLRALSTEMGLVHTNVTPAMAFACSSLLSAGISHLLAALGLALGCSFAFQKPKRFSPHHFSTDLHDNLYKNTGNQEPLASKPIQFPLPLSFPSTAIDKLRPGCFFSFAKHQAPLSHPSLIHTTSPALVAARQPLRPACRASPLQV